MEGVQRDYVCIVGNSSSLIGKGMGPRIDEFNNVCRINDWVVNGYQKHVGTKITHWVTGCGRQIPKWSKKRNLANKYTIVMWPPAVFPMWKQYAKKKFNTDGSLYEAVPYIKKELLRRWGYPLDKFSIWKDNDSEDLYDTRENITFVPEYISQRIAANTVAYPTTGLATIAYFKFVLKYNVYTIGFDFFQNKAHYWDGNKGLQTKIENHSLQAERNIYANWVKEGLINEL